MLNSAAAVRFFFRARPPEPGPDRGPLELSTFIKVTTFMKATMKVTIAFMLHHNHYLAGLVLNSFESMASF